MCVLTEKSIDLNAKKLFLFKKSKQISEYLAEISVENKKQKSEKQRLQPYNITFMNFKFFSAMGNVCDDFLLFGIYLLIFITVR